MRSRLSPSFVFRQPVQSLAVGLATLMLVSSVLFVVYSIGYSIGFLLEQFLLIVR